VTLGIILRDMTWFAFSWQNFWFSFLALIFEGIPFVLLGSLISGNEGQTHVLLKAESVDASDPPEEAMLY
jgi:hypothetical protein